MPGNCTTTPPARSRPCWSRAPSGSRLRRGPCAPSRAELETRAVEELEEYAFRAGSGRVAAHADWIAIGDPDLRGLIGCDEFQLWASHHLPRDIPKKHLRGVVNVDRYTARVVRQAALVFAHAWQVRANDDATPAEIVRYRWLQERGAWSRLGKVCLDHQSWPQRLSAIETFRGWLREAQNQYWIDFPHETQRGSFESVTVRPAIFEQIATLVCREGPATGDAGWFSILGWATDRAAHVTAAYDAGARAIGNGDLDPEEERREALRAGQLWSCLASSLNTELNDTSSDGNKSAPIQLLKTTSNALEGEAPQQSAGRA